MSTFNLNFEILSGVVYIAPAGRIDSTNAKNFSNNITSIRAKYPNSEIVFDCAQLDYISSAGLRILLNFSKKENTQIKLINVSQGIADILEVTGFSTIFDVSRPIRDISDEQATFMGMSSGISLYRMSNDTILKLYPTWQRLDDVKKELRYTKAALLSGVPALISYDIVTFENRYGIIYEMPNVKTVSSLLILQPWKIDQFAAELGQTLKQINLCSPAPGVLPKTSEMLTEKVLKLDKYFNTNEIHELISIIHAIPAANTVVYGSYQPGNIFVMNDELILINMSTISCGNPVYDLGITYMACVLEADWLIKRISDLDVSQSKRLWNGIIRSYFGTDDEEFIKNKENFIKAVALLCSALLPSFMNITNEEAERIVAKARQNVFPKVEDLTAILSQANL